MEQITSIFDYVVITGLLIVGGLYLKNWQPPIKKQYIAGILLAIGALLGLVIVSNTAYGFLIAGLVYYKDELVEEVRDVRESFDGIKDEVEDGKKC